MSTPTTATVTGVISDLQGNAQANVRVRISLNTAQATSISPVCVLSPLSITATTDSTGSLTVNLVPNTNINPTNTVYIVETPAWTFQISVGAGGGDWQSLIVNAPSALSPTVQNPTVSGNLTVNGTSHLVGAATFDGGFNLTAGTFAAPTGSIPLSAVSGTKGTSLGVFGKRVLPSAAFGGATQNNALNYYTVGYDSANNILHFADQTNVRLIRSTDGGATYNSPASAGLPTNITASNVSKILTFGTNWYLLGYNSVTNVNEVYQAAAVSGNTQPTWTLVKSLTAGTTARAPGPTMNADSTYIYVGEYQIPNQANNPIIWRSPDGVTWTNVYTTNTRHVHCVAPDPNNAGNVYATLGDGQGSNIRLIKSTDHGTTWTTVITGTWSAVQISFDANWIYLAPDNGSGASLIVLDRSTLTPAVGALNSHFNTAVPAAATTTDRYFENAYFGAVDPNTGIYYFVANDTASTGTTMGLFMLPAVGGYVSILDKGGVNNNMNGEIFITSAKLFTGNWQLPLLSLTA